MSGKGYDNDEEHQTLTEILTLALGWTHSVSYIVTVHLLILVVQIYLFLPLLPDLTGEWGGNVEGMIIIQYWTALCGGYGYTTPVPEIASMLGPFSHMCGMAVIVMLLSHTVTHQTLMWVAIPSSLWFGFVFLFNLVDSIRMLASPKHPLLC